jgi:hypothetical protein
MKKAGDTDPIQLYNRLLGTSTDSKNRLRILTVNYWYRYSFDHQMVITFSTYNRFLSAVPLPKKLFF